MHKELVMSFFRERGLAARITLASVLVCAGLMGAAAFTVWRLQDVSAVSDQTAKNRIPQLAEIAQVELNVTRVAVQVDGSNVAYVKKALWVERPARLFARLLAETIRAKGRLVLENEPGSGSSQVLSGRLLAMGYDAASQSAVVRFDAIRTSGGQISTRRFEASQPAGEGEGAVLGPALNRAANDVARQVAEWVG